jgi:FlaA1/EpsC-like NDP-sugar epimerase
MKNLSGKVILITGGTGSFGNRVASQANAEAAALSV